MGATARRKSRSAEGSPSRAARARWSSSAGVVRSGARSWASLPGAASPSSSGGAVVARSIRSACSAAPRASIASGAENPARSAHSPATRMVKKMHF